MEKGERITGSVTHWQSSNVAILIAVPQPMFALSTCWLWAWSLLGALPKKVSSISLEPSSIYSLMTPGSVVLTTALRCYPVCIYCELIGDLQDKEVNTCGQVVMWNKKRWDYFPTLTAVLCWLSSLFNKMFTESNFSNFILFHILSVAFRYGSYHRLTFASFGRWMEMEATGGRGPVRACALHRVYI